MFKSVLTTFLLASYLPAVLADKCSAVGWQSDQSVVKYGFQGVQMGVKLYRGDDLIGDYKPCSKCQTACTDYVDVKGDGLEEPFGWAASCNINHFT